MPSLTLRAILCIALIFTGYWNANAQESAEKHQSPEKITKQAAEQTSETEELRFSDLRPAPYDYQDYAYLLETTVIITGKSDRRKPSDTILLESGGGKGGLFGDGVTTRAKTLAKGYYNPNVSRLEGNRIGFHVVSLDKDIRAAVKTMLADMQSWPSEQPLERRSKDEQLSYWLNLHNAAIYHLVAENYPINQLGNWLYGKGGKDNQFERKWLEVNGTLMSLNDIKTHVFANWSDPLVFYGFWHATVGSPNIQYKPYTAPEVWDMLLDGGEDFVQSLRGVRMINTQTGTVKVSKLYKEIKPFFKGDFTKGFKKHLMLLAEGFHEERLATAKRFKFTYYDKYPADVLNGRWPRYAFNEKDLAPGHASILMREIITRNLKPYNQRDGLVGVEQVDAGKAEDAEDNNN